MKHSLKITVILLLMFFVAQIIGIAVVDYYSPVVQQVNSEDGNLTNFTSYNLPYGFDPPQKNDPKINLASVIFSILFAVVIMFILMKLKAEIFLRIWFFVVVALAIGLTLNAGLSFIGEYASVIAIFIGASLAYFKVFKRNIIVHNLTEVIIYPGIAAIFVPLLSVWTVFILLIFISIYDIYAVWHAGFMQKMAKYQMEKLRFFSGFLIPYLDKKQRKMIEMMKKKKSNNKKLKINLAILGGGDVVFPIILSGVVLHSWGILPALIIALGATVALAILFYFSEKGKFYPAMPFISAGCFVALTIAYFIR